MPFYLEPGYRVALTPDEDRLNKKLQVAWKAGNPLGIDECCKSLDLSADERSYRLGGGVDGAAVPLKALKWRRQYGLGKCRNDPARFAQEYPANLAEAFLASGRPAFSPHVIAGWKAMGEPDLLDVPGCRGNAQATSLPVAGRRYRYGVDVAEGCEVPDDSLDYTACIVHDPIEKRVVALYRSQETPRVAAGGIVALTKRYPVDNDGVVVERNGPGLALLDRLVDAQVPVWGPRPKEIGFRTTGESRPFILGFLQDQIRDNAVQNPGFPVLLDELQDMQQTRSRLDHVSGRHDDTVIAWALALSPLARASERAEDVEPAKPDPGKVSGKPVTLDIAWELEQARLEDDQE